MVWYTFHHTWEVSNTLFMNYLQTSRAKANHKVTSSGFLFANSLKESMNLN